MEALDVSCEVFATEGEIEDFYLNWLFIFNESRDLLELKQRKNYQNNMGEESKKILLCLDSQNKSHLKKEKSSRRFLFT